MNIFPLQPTRFAEGVAAVENSWFCESVKADATRIFFINVLDCTHNCVLIYNYSWLRKTFNKFGIKVQTNWSIFSANRSDLSIHQFDRICFAISVNKLAFDQLQRIKRQVIYLLRSFEK